MTIVQKAEILESNVPRDGVLVATGFGLRLAVERGHLIVEDGIGDERRRARLSRLDRHLKRVVVLGHTGTISLEAVRWLHGVGVPLTHLNSDGAVYFVAAPSGAIDPLLRRSQALAAETGLGVRLSQELIASKVRRHAALLQRLNPSVGDQEALQRLLQAIGAATRLSDLRRLEALAARVYWRAWQAVPVTFANRDRSRVPRHWLSFGTRASPLTGGQSPRKAVNPAGAVLNYAYSLLEAEARIAALSVGLDPVLGLLHADTKCRDSIVFDLMEPARPAVDAFVLEFLAQHTFTREEVVERLDGQCRLLPPLTERLARTTARWAREVVPLAHGLVGQLLAAERAQTARARAARALSPGHGEALRRPRRARRVVVREYGRQVDPETDPRRAPAAGAKRRETMRHVVAQNQRWAGPPGDPVAFRQAIAPRLSRIKLADLVTATGLTKGACSRIRAGQVVPHARHWAALRQLAEQQAK